MTTAVQPNPASEYSPRTDAAAGSRVGAELAEAAARLSVEALLRCWIRERRVPRPAAADLVLRIGPGSVTVPVRYWSAAGWHRFGPACTEQGGPVAPGQLARWMAEAGADPAAISAGPDRPDNAAATTGRARTCAAATDRADNAAITGRAHTCTSATDQADNAAATGPAHTCAAATDRADNDAAVGHPSTSAATDRAGNAAAPDHAYTYAATDPASNAAAAQAATSAAAAQVTAAAATAAAAAAASHATAAPTPAAPPPAAAEELAGRVAESAERIAVHLADRAAHPAPPDPASGGAPTTPFLAAEQALLAGHPLHPTPKSRDGLTEPAYSPELRGGFQLDWFSVDASLVAEDSEIGPTARDLCTFLSGTLPDDGVLVPAHPWQAAELLRRPGVRELVAAGRLRHRGRCGARWFPTSSLRTVYRPDAPVMLKLSLGLKITNSRRENLRKELLRGVEAHRLFAGPAGTRLLAAHPNFRMLTDAAYLAVDGVPGLDVSVRHSPFRPTDYVYCVAALTDLGRGAIAPDGAPHELAAHLRGLAEASGRGVREVTVDWFGCYVDRLIAPLLWLDAELGVTLEGHQQNTLIQLDEHGYPGAGWYRDNQGYYYRASRVAELEQLAGMPELGRASDTVVEDRVVTERLIYYVGINNLFGMVGALGCAGLAEERELLHVARERLSGLRGHEPTELLLNAATLPCKANLLTRAAGLDELVGDLATQSVYVEIPNPCAQPGGA